MTEAMTDDTAVQTAQGLAGPAPFPGTLTVDVRSPLEPPLDAVVAVPVLHRWFATLPARHDDVAVFESASMRHAGAAPLDGLAHDLGELIEAARTGGPDECTFDIDVPGFGRMEGRVRTRRGRADVELHALQPAAAAALRARLPQLQREVELETAGDVHLFIV